MDEKNISMKPEICVFAGPNGSGKSTFSTPEWIIPPYINADELAARDHLSQDAAAILATKQREEAVAAMQSFTFETVMSKERNLILLENAKDAGYFIRGYYILTRNPLINIARVYSRVKAGGHDVPKKKILSRYYESIDLLPRLFRVCDILHVYDNSDDTPWRIVRKHKDSILIYPNEHWTEQKIQNVIGINQ